MEQRNWKIIKFFLVIAIVFGVLFWVRTTIRNEFSRLSRENSLNLARSVASVEPNLLAEKFPEIYYYISYFDGTEIENVEISDVLKRLPDYEYGQENAMYEEFYISNHTIKLSGKEYFAIFAPVEKDYDPGQSGM